MSIYNNIDGANKEISQPYVNIDGTWKEVDLEYTNIDGTWKKVFEKTKKYKINLYRYGELYTTLECAQGSSIQLVTVPTVQSDDVAHYGWTRTAGNTSRNYDTTATITPTADMNLYAVFSYTKTTVTYTIDYTRGTGSINLPMAGTITVGGTVQGVSYNNGVQRPTMGAITLYSNGTAPYCQVGASYVSGTGSGTFGTLPNLNYPVYRVGTKDVSAGTIIRMLGKTESSGNTYNGHEANYYVAVQYPSGTSTATAYRSKI